MKKFYLFALAFALGTQVSLAQDAEDVDDTFCFVKADASVVENGSTVTLTELTVEDDGFGDVNRMMKSGLFVHNNYGDANLKVKYNIRRIDNGNFQICFPMNCTTKDAVGEYETPGGSLAGDETRDMQTEWLPTGDGECIVDVKLVVCDAVKQGIITNYYDLADGPSITLHFINNSAGVTAADSRSSKTVVSRFDLSGQRLSAPRNGLNIVRMSDGTVRKVVVK